MWGSFSPDASPEVCTRGMELDVAIGDRVRETGDHKLNVTSERKGQRKVIRYYMLHGSVLITNLRLHAMSVPMLTLFSPGNFLSLCEGKE